MKKGLIILVLCLSFSMLPEQSQAAQTLEVVLRDCLWGTGIGALADAATIPFMKHPGYHYIRILQGASIGLFSALEYDIYDIEIHPVYYSYTTPSRQKEQVYGLSVDIPSKL